MRRPFLLFRPRTRATHRLVWSLGAALLALAVTLVPRAGFAMPEGGPAYLVKDINTDTQDLSLYDLTAVGNIVYFFANESAGSVGLWKSDGTTTGTTRIAGNLSQYSGLTVVNGTVFFSNQSELWKIDGTAGRSVLVKKIGAERSPYVLEPLASLQNSLYFFALYATAPTELWKSDGTSNGTLRVKTFDLQVPSSTTSLLPNTNDVSCPARSATACGIGQKISAFPVTQNSLFFVFDYGSHKDLWKTDGTDAGTIRLKAFTDIDLRLSVDLGGVLFFIVEQALWRSDGTPAGTTLVTTLPNLVAPHIRPTPPDSTISVAAELINLNGRLFLSIFMIDSWDGPLYRSGLWISDGTAAGSTFLKDVDASYLTPFGDRLFFAGNDYTHGRELWVSDGTAAGTNMVKDSVPGTRGVFDVESQYPPFDINLFSYNGALFFTSGELWKSDGTAAGTTIVRDIYPGGDSTPSHVTNVNGTLFFAATGTTRGRELWKSDGTQAGTTLVKDINLGGAWSEPDNLINANGRLFFTADDGTHGRELWISDGTSTGTHIVIDFNRAPNSSQPSLLQAFNGTLLFSASGDSGAPTLWKSNGLAAGTSPLAVDSPVSVQFDTEADFTDLNGTLFFVGDDIAHGVELWKTDGAAGSTALVKDIAPGSASSYPGYTHRTDELARFYTLNNMLLFAADDGAHGYELWASNGTEAGTTLVKDLAPGELTSWIGAFSNVNGIGIFAALAETAPFQTKFGLWKTNGTEAGTTLIKDFPGGNIGELVLANGSPFFTGYDGAHGLELWKSDGTPAGTTLVKDIFPGADSALATGVPLWFTNIDGTLMFIADDGAHGFELWKSDGTSAGTTLVKDINPGAPSSNPCQFRVVDGKLYFLADDGTHGLELWKSDGSADGTMLVKDIQPGAPSSNPGALATYDLGHFYTMSSTLFFPADDGVHGLELWKSDGTPAGTTLIKDIFPGAGSPNIRAVSVVSDTLLFSADDSSSSSAFWRSDGTPAGTSKVQDLLPGTTAGDPTLVGHSLFFGATDDTHGEELWAIPVADAAQPTLNAPGWVAVAPGGMVGIPIRYRNTGMTMATAVTLAATLEPSMTYAGDSLGIQPSVSNNVITWRLPNLGFLDGRELRLLVHAPNAPLGSHYPVVLQLSMGGITSTVRTEVRIANLNYLPAIRP